MQEEMQVAKLKQHWDQIEEISQFRFPTQKTFVFCSVVNHLQGTLNMCPRVLNDTIRSIFSDHKQLLIEQINQDSLRANETQQILIADAIQPPSKRMMYTSQTYFQRNKQYSFPCHNFFPFVSSTFTPMFHIYSIFKWIYYQKAASD